MSAFGHYIRELRKSRGMLQKQLACSLGVEASYVSNLETGIRLSLGDQMLERLRIALNLTDEEMLKLDSMREAAKGKLVIPPYASAEEIEVIRLLANCAGKLPPQSFGVIKAMIESWNSGTGNRTAA